MSELGYGSENDPLPASINDEIVTYLTGSCAKRKNSKTFIGNFINVFRSRVRNFVIAFTDKNIVIGELNKGNISQNEKILPYNNVVAFNYYNKSGNLEILTMEDERYLLKVSKYELTHNIKHLNQSLVLKYFD
ncbi:MAG: hypothetical protein ACRC57_11105 [Sarcina sp.]